MVVTAELVSGEGLELVEVKLVGARSAVVDRVLIELRVELSKESTGCIQNWRL